MGIHDAIHVGDVEVVTLCDGFAPLPLRDECPGQDVDWAAERVSFPWAFVDDANWAWHVHAFLLRTPGGDILIDTGIGHLGVSPYDVSGRIDSTLAAAGVEPAGVRHVIHTHLHADHAGGACRPDGEPRFPNAVHHVHPADWNFFAGSDDPEDFNGRGAMTRLEELGMLNLSPEDREVAPGVQVIHTPGHTPGHRSIALVANESRALFAGDLLHVPSQIAHPDWPSSHDNDPAMACSSRETQLARARDGGWLVAVSHFGRPFGRVGDDGWLAE